MITVDLIAWVLVVIALSTFVVETAFMQVASAKRVLAAGVRMPLDIRIVSYCWLAVGIPADFVFNVTRGTWMFRELPRELMFSSRVERHFLHSADWRGQKAAVWVRVLNAVDPGHVGD